MPVVQRRMGRPRVGPIAHRVGAEFTQPFGNINYVAGLATPLELLKVGALAYLDLDFYLTLNYTQAAGAAAWTAQPGFPWTILQQSKLQVGNRGAFDSAVSGYGILNRELFQHPAYQAAFTAPLPAANAGTQAVSGTLNWTWKQRLPITWDEADLRGLLYMASQSANAYLIAQFAPLANVVTIPNCSSGTLSGQLSVTGYGYDLGDLTPADFTLAHVLMEVPVALQQGVTTQQVPLIVGEVVQRIFLQAYVNGSPDTTGQIALSTVEIQMGIERPQRWAADELAFSNQLRDRANLPNGVWVLNWANPGAGGRQYHDWRRLPQAFLNLSFSSGVPANAQLYLLYEFQRDLLGR
jgi:hypothetical protein